MEGDSRARCQMVSSCISGAVFAAGWWCFIDGFNMGMNVAQDSNSKAASGYAWLPPFVATLFYAMINGMHWRELKEENVSTPQVATKAKVFLLFTLFTALCGIIGAAFMYVQNGAPRCLHKKRKSPLALHPSPNPPAA